MKRLGDGETLSPIDRDAAPLHPANDLEGVERVSAGRVPHLVEKRSRQDEPQMRLHDLMQSAGVERAHVHAHDAVGGERRRAPAGACCRVPNGARGARLCARTAVVGPRTPGRRPRPDRATERVDRDDDGAIVGECAQRAQEREADRVGVRWRPFLVTEDKRARKRSGLYCRQGRERKVEHGTQEIADAGERERRLALGRAGREDAEPTVARFLETRLPEGRLSDAGVAFRGRPRQLPRGCSTRSREGTRARPAVPRRQRT